MNGASRSSFRKWPRRGAGAAGAPCCAALLAPLIAGPPYGAREARLDLILLIVLAALGLTFAALLTWEALQRGIRLRREAREEHERTLFLAAAGEEFSRSIDLDKLLEVVCRKATQVLGNASIIHLIEEDSDHLRLACAFEDDPPHNRDLSELLRTRPVKRGQGISGTVAQTGEPLLVPDYTASPYASRFGADTLGVKAALSVPLVVGERTLGVLTVLCCEEGSVPTENDLRLAALLADRAAIGLDHARLYRRMENLVDERTQELREAHERLLEAERSQAIAELAAMVAHEVRNPLHVVRTTTFALKQRLHGQDPRTDRNLEQLERNVDAASRIIQDLMDYAACPEPAFEVVDLSPLARQTAEEIPLPEGVELVTQIEPEALPVRCDRLQVQRAVRSLLLNGVQAHDHPGRVTLKVFCRDNCAVIEVHDTGRGVPEADRQRLFKPLFTTKVKGAGLGLALSRRILEANGGRLEFDSSAGPGTTFRVWLPLTEPASLEAADEDADEETEGLSSGSVQANQRG